MRDWHSNAPEIVRYIAHATLTYAAGFSLFVDGVSFEYNGIASASNAEPDFVRCGIEICPETGKPYYQG